jgi:flagellin-like protein
MESIFNKRGVSPLIATVLLISFAVALGSVVLNWGRNLDISGRDDLCSGVVIKIRNVGNYQACYGGLGKNAHINFIIDNEGGVDVEGLGIWIVGEKGTKLQDFDELSIKSGELLDKKDKAVAYDFDTYGKIQHIQFIPKVKTEDSTDICPRNSVKVESVGPC